MSQKAVESLLGRLITDRELRSQFYEQPAATCAKEGLELTTRELGALLALDQASVEGFAQLVDARIVRASGVTRPMSSVARSPVQPTAIRAFSGSK